MKIIQINGTHTNVRCIFLFFTLFLASCTENQVSYMSWVKPPPQAIDCVDNFSEGIPIGVQTKNVLNKHATKHMPWLQCFEKRVIIGEEQLGWSLPFGRRVVFTYEQ